MLGAILNFIVGCSTVKFAIYLLHYLAGYLSTNLASQVQIALGIFNIIYLLFIILILTHLRVERIPHPDLD